MTTQTQPANPYADAVRGLTAQDLIDIIARPTSCPISQYSLRLFPEAPQGYIPAPLRLSTGEYVQAYMEPDAHATLYGEVPEWIRDMTSNWRLRRLDQLRNWHQNPDAGFPDMFSIAPLDPHSFCTAQNERTPGKYAVEPYFSEELLHTVVKDPAAYPYYPMSLHYFPLVRTEGATKHVQPDGSTMLGIHGFRYATGRPATHGVFMAESVFDALMFINNPPQWCTRFRDKIVLEGLHRWACGGFNAFRECLEFINERFDAVGLDDHVNIPAHFRPYTPDYSADEDEEDAPVRDNAIIHDYHDSPRRKLLPSHMHDLGAPTLGFEIEMEADSETEHLDLVAQDIYDADPIYGVTFEQDGSLEFGFEMITHFGALDAHEKPLKKVLREATKFMEAYDRDTCGLHIHLGRDTLSKYEQIKLALFCYSDNTRGFLTDFARRECDEYASFNKVDQDTLKTEVSLHKAGDPGASTEILETHPYYYLIASWLNSDKSYLSFAEYVRQHTSLRRIMSPSKYTAVNFGPRDTIEFRMFKGTLSHASVMACAEFVHNLHDFVKVASLQELTVRAFLRYVYAPEQFGITRYLRPFLERQVHLSSPIYDRLIKRLAQQCPHKEAGARWEWVPKDNHAPYTRDYGNVA